MNPDRVVVGADEELRAASPTASPRCTSRSAAPIVRTDVASAEMIKLASNAFLATKISFINEIANVSEELGADVNEVARGMGLDTRIGPQFLQRGHRLRRLAASRRTCTALKQLAGNTGYHFQLLTAVIEVNELQKRRTIGKLQKHLGSLVGKEIALLGVAFKPNTDDIREATSLVLAGPAAGRGRARARLRPGRGRARRASCSAARAIASSALEALDGADARRARDRVARVPRARLGRRGQATDGARRWSSTGATSSTARRSRRPASRYEGIGR